jgi:hypothetical protein
MGWDGTGRDGAHLVSEHLVGGGDERLDGVEFAPQRHGLADAVGEHVVDIRRALDTDDDALRIGVVRDVVARALARDRRRVGVEKTQPRARQLGAQLVVVGHVRRERERQLAVELVGNLLAHPLHAGHRLRAVSTADVKAAAA